MEQGFHSFVGHQGVSAAGAFVNVVTCTSDPVVFLVTQAARQDVARHYRAMTVTTKEPPLSARMICTEVLLRISKLKWRSQILGPKGIQGEVSSDVSK